MVDGDVQKGGAAHDSRMRRGPQPIRRKMLAYRRSDRPARQARRTGTRGHQAERAVGVGRGG
eukprot:1832438-Pleurochrysis_carterae.AAC.1